MPRPITEGEYGDPTPELTTYGNIKLGWIEGVLIPCLLNIWGVMLFLRIAWVVAQAGIMLTVIIVSISCVVCVITTLSLSAICTNGQLQGGGVYFLVSRSLGPELGASVGIIFAFANAVAASMNTIGFCESFNELLKLHGYKIIDNDVNDTRIVGAIMLFILCFICAVGMDWETRTQNFLITVILLAITNYIVGVCVGPKSDLERAQGFVGLSLEQAQVNMFPDYRYSEGVRHDFFSVFAIYFPSVTGVQAGANICGDLKDPATAIPKGTLLAVAVSTASYLSMTVLAGMGALRDASGLIKDIGTSQIDACKPRCEYGLHNNYQVMHIMALWGPLIYGGCWAATLSTALTNLLAVPRLIQALGWDHIYPGLVFFSKRYGKHGEPYRGYVLVFTISLMFLLIADLNTIAPLITNFYLASYALINFCTFRAGFFSPLTWRPQFTAHNKWLSLVGCLMCIAIMVIISWVMALVTLILFVVLYVIVLYRKPVAYWGSSKDAQQYQNTVASLLDITRRPNTSLYFNPQLLVLSGRPYERQWLLEMASLLTKSGSFMIATDIETKRLTVEQLMRLNAEGEQWLRALRMRGFFVAVNNDSMLDGLRSLLQCTGLGRVAPNIVWFGLLYKWQEQTHQKLLTYHEMIQLPFEYKMALVIIHMPDSERMRPHNDIPSSRRPSDASTLTLNKNVWPRISDLDMEETDESSSDIPQSPDRTSSIRDPEEVTTRVNVAQKYIYSTPLNITESTTLDAWWLYEDGGINILLPYIIARRSGKVMRFKIFALAKTSATARARNFLIERLHNLRISYTELHVVTGISVPPSEETWSLFHKIIENHRNETYITDAEYSRLLNKTTRYLRLRELLLEHSRTADLIVLTLPNPRKDVSPAMYLAWLDVLSYEMPPMVFVRGTAQVLEV